MPDLKMAIAHCESHAGLCAAVELFTDMSVESEEEHID